jgi:uncharacterized repeat protein (TIGR01451 family)
VIVSTATARRLTQAAAATSTFAILGVGIAAAWHPNGVITKGVTNVTAGQTTVSAANTLSDAISAKPGDVLKYSIVITNASPTANSYDDLAFVKFADALPTGVTLVSGQTQETIGPIKAQKSVTRTITVKVDADAQDGDVLRNDACFSGEASNHEAGTQQNKCDSAYVKVTVPQATPTPTPKPTATPLATPVATPKPTPGQGGGEVLGTETTTLPTVGGETATAALGLTAMVGTTVAYIRSRRRK